MRVAFATALVELAATENRLFVITNDLGYSVLEPFIEKYPTRYLNIGIAEQNMMGVAAGLALSGKISVVFSIIPFATMRCYEQLRNDICYHNLNVKVVGVGSGLSYGSLGATHHSVEDIAITRVLPNLTVICPGDPIETRFATMAMVRHKGPVYLRIHKKGDRVIYKRNPHLVIGKAITVIDGNDATLVVAGNMLPTAVDVVEKLHGKGIGLKLLSMHTIKPLDKGAIIRAARETKAIFTLEEHSVIGGLGSAVAEVLAESETAVLFRRLGIKDRFTKEVGGQEYLRKVNHLSVADIYRYIRKTLLRLSV